MSGASTKTGNGRERVVTARLFEDSLTEITSDCDPLAGLFGPRSTMWTVGRESALMLGGLRSVLLQLAHPFISESLKYVSGPGRNVRERFVETMRSCSALTFGDREEVIATARNVFAIHRRVGGRFDSNLGRFASGTHFRANEADALWWVAATLWDSSLLAFERFVRPLSPAEKDAYLADCRCWTRLFGVPEEVMSTDWPSFERYMQEMLASDTLAVSDRARNAAEHILRPSSWLTSPLYSWIRVMTTAQLPPRLRDEFGFPYGRKQRRIAETSEKLLRPVIRHLPKTLRYNPMYIRALRRLEGKQRDHPVSEVVVRILVSALR